MENRPRLDLAEVTAKAASLLLRTAPVDKQPMVVGPPLLWPTRGR